MKGARITRGDGKLIDVTADYTDAFCDVTVEVKNAHGVAIANAKVQLFAPLDSTCCQWFLTDWTDSSGQLNFRFGANGQDIEVWGRVISGETHYPADDSLERIFAQGEAGQHYTWQVQLPD